MPRGNKKGKNGKPEAVDGDDSAAVIPPATEAPQVPAAVSESPATTPARPPENGARAPPPTPMTSFDAPPQAASSMITTPPAEPRDGSARGPASYGAVDSRNATRAAPPSPIALARSDSDRRDNSITAGDRVITMSHQTGATRSVPMESEVLITRRLSTGSGKESSGSRSTKPVDMRLTAQITRALSESWQLKLLLVAVPIAIFGEGHLGPSALFAASFVGLVPLAGLLGDFTEDLAKHSNDVIGALLNVTFGNATELIISIMALRAGMMDVIKLSLIGSVMGNMLLVLGTAFLVGGMRVKTMVFNADAANTYGPLLILAVLGFVIPSAYWSAAQSILGDKAIRKETVLTVSRQEALVLCIVYMAYLYFQLVTHKNAFDDAEPSDSAVIEVGAAESDDEEDDDEPQFTLAFGLAGLAIASILISFLSDVLVGTLTEAAETWNVPKQFIGIILVPIVGNAAEHATAIVMASKNKLDIAVGVALGSSIQIALFVMPVLVLIGWLIDAPLTLNFHPFLTVITTVCVLVVNQVVGDGKTNWLEGLMLISAYVMLSLVFWNGTIDMS